MSFSIGSVAPSASLFSDIAISGAGKAKASRSENLAPEPSAVVTLSEDAKILGRLAEKGMSLSMRPLNGNWGNGGSAATGSRTDSTDQVLSKEEFQSLLGHFGATDDEKSRLTAAFDQDRNGEISRNEFLKVIAGTSKATSADDPASSLLGMIDRNGDSNGSVNLKELVRFTTAFADAQQHKTSRS